MKKRYIIVSFVAVSLVLATFFTVFAEKSHENARKLEKSSQKVEPRATIATLLAAVNAERAKYSVAPLVEDSRLDASAQAKACDEYDNHYFGHVSPSGVQGYTTAEAALSNVPGNYSENLTEPTPVTTTQSMYNWDSSKLHHDAMINSHYTLTGFGVCGNEVVEHFYSPTNL